MIDFKDIKEMIKKLTEAFDFEDVEQDEHYLENTISGIRLLGDIEESIKNQSLYKVRHQVSDTFDGFVEFVEKELPYIVSRRESIVKLLEPKSQVLSLVARIKDRSSREYGIGTLGFKETIDKMFSTIKKAFELLGFSEYQSVGQKIQIKVMWNDIRIPYTGEDYTSANVLRAGLVYSLYEILSNNIECIVNTFSFDLTAIVDNGRWESYVGHFDLMSHYANPGKDRRLKSTFNDNYKIAFQDAVSPNGSDIRRITTQEFNEILKIGKDYVNLKKSPILFEAFDFTEDTPTEDIDSQIEHNKTLALYKSSSMHDAVVDKFKELKRRQGGYGLPLNVAISKDSLWMVDYIVQDALDIFADGDIRKFYDERGMCIFFRYCENNVRPFDFSLKVDNFVIDFDNAGMIHNYLESLVNTIKKYESKWIYNYEQYARFLINLEIKGYDFSNLSNLGYYIGFLLGETLRFTINGKKFSNLFGSFYYIRDEKGIEECLDRTVWYSQILAEKFTKEELLKFTKDFIRGNKDRKDFSLGLNESFDFDSDEDEDFNFDDIIESHRYKKFLEDNYNIRSVIRPYKKDGKLFIDIDGNVKVKNEKLTSLTNGQFCFGKVRGHFDCNDCKSLTSLEGAPEKVGGNFYCFNCESLKSLEGAPKKVGGCFSFYNCKSLTSLEGAPREMSGGFYCERCSSLKSLDGAPKEVGGDFDCNKCISLTSLKGAPKEVGGDFDCSWCESLKTLEGAPSKVGGNFKCHCCKSLTSIDFPTTTKIKGEIIR